MIKPFQKLLLPLWPTIWISAACSLATVLANIGLMAAAAYLLSLAALHPPLATLSTAIVSVRFFGLSRAFFRYLERYSGHNAALRLLAALRIHYYRSLVPLSAVELKQYASADLFTRFVTDVETLKFLPVRLLIPLLVAIVTLCMLTALLAGLHWQLSMILLIGVLLLGGSLPWYFYQQDKKWRHLLSLRRLKFHAVVVDSVRGIRDWAVFDATGMLRRRFVDANSRFIEAAQVSHSTAASCDAAGMFIAQATLLASLAVLVKLVERGELAGVSLAAWALLVQSSFEAFYPLSNMIRYLGEIRDSARRLTALPAMRPVSVAALSPSLSAPYRLVASNIGCRYPASQQAVLSQVSLELFPGKHVAVVGPSGAGKSTMIAILSGQQPPDEGELYLNDYELYRLTPTERNRLLGVALQHDHLFHATIADNLRLAKPAASDEELWHVLDQVFLAGTIRQLPNQLETALGSEGYGLSGGERRRLSLARLLLKDPPIYLLDEPTAGLDSQLAGQLLAKGGPLLRPDRTVLLVTHQADALSAMDEILVLDAGKLVEQGTLPQLLDKRGLFYDMCKWQQDRLYWSASAGKETK